MILYEFEGKELISKYGINIPSSQLITKREDLITLNAPLMVKAQVLSGKRKDVGGIVKVQTQEETLKEVSKMLGSKINNELVDKVLVEELVEHNIEYYVSIFYDTKTRGPILSFSEAGGTGIEQRKVEIFKINPINFSIAGNDDSKLPEAIKPVISKLLEAFFNSDLLLLEINPLVITLENKVIALDAKIKTDDVASARHDDWNYPPRAIPGYSPTNQEIEAKKIDEGDYRGTAGSTYFDLPGDIAVLASGGGASLTAMDALIAADGSPANYTEYSGNPPKEKVEKLTSIVLSKPNLHGLWVVGAIANFTDIYQTLSGFLEALRKVNPKPNFPIVIRRGGPHDKEAFEMLKEIKDFDLYLYGQEISITESATIMASKAKQYAITTK